MAQRTLFIINPTAGGAGGLQRWLHFERTVLDKSRSWEKVFTKEPGQAERLAVEASEKFEVLAAVGGDGTVCEVANGILTSKDSKACLAIVPCGTGNDIAAGLRLRDPNDAAKALAQFNWERMDVIRIDCLAGGHPCTRHALLFAGAGVIGPLLRKATPLVKRLLGRAFAYRIGLVRALWGHRSARMKIDCDGRSFDDQFLFLGASNGETAGGGMKIAPGARTNDGVLNVNLVGNVGFLEGLKQIRRLSQGRHTAHPKVRYFAARHISVHSDESVEIAADGELLGYAPARFEIKPAALSVLTNPE